MAENYVVWFDKLRMTDVEHVGGKNASLGEMISQLASSGVRVPGGFATTAQAYRDFLAHNGLSDRINEMLAKLDVEDVVELARVGKEIRQLIVDTPFPAQLENEIRTAYEQMVADSGAEISVAVRSSATAEDLPDASFAGQQETFLNIRGFDNVMGAIKHVFCLALQRPRYLVSRPQGLCSRCGRLVRRYSTHGAFRLRCSRRDVHHRYRIGF